MIDLRRIPVTTTLLAAIIVVFMVETVTGGATDPQVLLRLGANFPPLVRAGEYWRLLASMFLHVGVMHLLFNGWALLQLGRLCEALLGSWRTAVVYFVSGIAASLASVVFTNNLSAGASGAIFGLLGALISFLLRRRRALLPQGKGLLGQLVMWAGINVVLGFSIPHIDNAAHLGGFAAGLLLGLPLRSRPAPAEDEMESVPGAGGERGAGGGDGHWAGFGEVDEGHGGAGDGGHAGGSAAGLGGGER
jgi:rhomboid protease GluP